MDVLPDSYTSLKSRKTSKILSGIKSNRLIFFLCLLIAVMFWLLIKLSEVYSVDYTFKVKYNNVPPEMRLTKLVDSTMDLNLTARGFVILKHNLFSEMDIIDINLSNYTVDYKGDKNYLIYTQELIPRMAELLNVDEKDIKLSRAVLRFIMEKTGERVIDVIPDYSIEFSPQFDLLNEVVVDPNNVLVYGPQDMIDTLSSIKTKKIDLTNISSDQIVEVSLDNPDPSLLSFSRETVTLNFDIEKFTELELTIPITTNMLPYNIKTFPSQVSVYFQVAQSDFNKVRSHQFTVAPAIENLDIVHVRKLPLKIFKHPDFVRNIRIVPSEIEFLIIK